MVDQLSDRFDRDRERLRSASGDIVGAASPTTSGPRRDQAPHLALSNRQTSSSSLTGMNGRRESRIGVTDKDRPSDLPARPNGDPRRHERTLTMNGKETSDTRNDKTDDWRRGESIAYTASEARPRTDAHGIV